MPEYVYKYPELEVGYYDVDKVWHIISTETTVDLASRRAAHLNGGCSMAKLGQHEYTSCTPLMG